MSGMSRARILASVLLLIHGAGCALIQRSYGQTAIHQQMQVHTPQRGTPRARALPPQSPQGPGSGAELATPSLPNLKFDMPPVRGQLTPRTHRARSSHRTHPWQVSDDVELSPPAGWNGSQKKRAVPPSENFTYIPPSFDRAGNDGDKVHGIS